MISSQFLSPTQIKLHDAQVELLQLKVQTDNCSANMSPEMYSKAAKRIRELKHALNKFYVHGDASLLACL
jgi:hypothetical protein